MTEPYYDYKGRNILFPGNERFVQRFLYEDEALHAEVALLRLNFMNNAQALLHGDLHSGSIFINERGLKVLDPEFAFYGPMGYDIGNVIGNLFFAWASKAFTMPDAEDAIAAIGKAIADTWDLTREKLERKFDACVTLPLCRVPAFKAQYLDGIMADAAGYAGTEIIRRTVGDSKVMEVSSVTDPEKRIPMERALIKLGIVLIKNRSTFRRGRELTEAFRLILA